MGYAFWCFGLVTVVMCFDLRAFGVCDLVVLWFRCFVLFVPFVFVFLLFGWLFLCFCCLAVDPLVCLD